MVMVMVVVPIASVTKQNPSTVPSRLRRGRIHILLPALLLQFALCSFLSVVDKLLLMPLGALRGLQELWELRLFELIK